MLSLHWCRIVRLVLLLSAMAWPVLIFIFLWNQCIVPLQYRYCGDTWWYCYVRNLRLIDTFFRQMWDAAAMDHVQLLESLRRLVVEVSIGMKILLEGGCLVGHRSLNGLPKCDSGLSGGLALLRLVRPYSNHIWWRDRTPNKEIFYLIASHINILLLLCFFVGCVSSYYYL